MYNHFTNKCSKMIYTFLLSLDMCKQKEIPDFVNVRERAVLDYNLRLAYI